jgi:uncharacterized OsmC-like protein
MTTTTLKNPKPARGPLNGVDTPNLLATIGAVGAQPELARFTWRAVNRWQQGTHSRTRVMTFSGAGGDHEHAREFVYDADHPAVLVGRDNGPTPVELLLVALSSCITAGIGNIAAVRGVTLYEVETQIEGDMDLQGILGLSESVRNGYTQIRLDVKIKGDAPPEKLQAIVEQSRARSAVFDVVTHGTDVRLHVNAA